MAAELADFDIRTIQDADGECPPFMGNFMLPVAEASRPAVGIRVVVDDRRDSIDEAEDELGHGITDP